MSEEVEHKSIQPAIAHLPVLEPRPSTRSFHGDDFVDDYEWIRYAPEKEIFAHLQAENEYFTAQTAHLKDLRKQLVSEYAAHTKEDDTSVPSLHGTYWYWSETRKGKAYPIVRRLAHALSPELPDMNNPDLHTSAEQVYDANALAEGEEFFAIGSMAISRDGRYCALAIDRNGSETFRVRIHEIATGVIVDEAVNNAVYGLVFNADGSRIYYLRADAAWRTCELWVHQVGTSCENDVLLWRENDERFEIGIDASRDGKWLILNTSSRTASEVYLLDLCPAGDPVSVTDIVDVEVGEQEEQKEYGEGVGGSCAMQNNTENFAGTAVNTGIAPVPELQDLHYPAPFSLAGRTEGVEYYVEPAAQGLLVMHNLHNSDFEIAVAAEVAPFELSSLPVVFSPKPGERVTEIAGFADFAAVLLRSEGMPQIRVLRKPVPEEQWQMGEALPSTKGEWLDFSANPVWDSRKIRIVHESLITPPAVGEYDIDSGELHDLKIAEIPNYRRDDYVEYIEWAVAADGTQIPITIAHKKTVQRDGKNPGYIYGYGSYECATDAHFVDYLISLLDRGIVVAFTHVRGGGEFGRSWYEQGKLFEKRNTFTDFIDSTQHLVNIGLLDPLRIAAEGRSAGGLLMGAIVNLRPDLYRAVIAGVPFVDALTTILKPELPLTVGEWEEWGNPIESAEVYAYMKSYSPYENISDVEYPAILATTSVNDVRVSFIEPTKWIAALRERTRNYFSVPSRPILLKTEMVAGHAGGSGRYQRWENRAQEDAFLLDQLGLRWN